MAFPPFKYTPPKATPFVGGLLTVANVVTLPPPDRSLGGVELQEVNYVADRPVTFVAPTGICTPTGEPAPPGPGLFPYGDVFAPVLIQVPVECDPTVTDAELAETATHIYEMRKGPLLEGYFFNVVLPSRAPVVSGSLAVEGVLATADLQTAAGLGVRTVHLNAYWATYLLGKGVIVKSGTTYRTALGNPIVFAGTYMDANEMNTAYITGPVHILQTAMETRTDLDYQRNDRYLHTSQVVTIAIEGPKDTVDRYTISTTAAFPDGNGGGATPPGGFRGLFPGFIPGLDATPGDETPTP